MSGPGDKSYFSVFCRDDFTNRKLVMTATRAELIAMILGGHITHLVWVVEWNEAEGWAKNITEDLARDLAGALEPGYEPRNDIRDFLEEQLGVGRAIPAAA